MLVSIWSTFLLQIFFWNLLCKRDIIISVFHTNSWIFLSFFRAQQIMHLPGRFHSIVRLLLVAVGINGLSHFHNLENMQMTGDLSTNEFICLTCAGRLSFYCSFNWYGAAGVTGTYISDIDRYIYNSNIDRYIYNSDNEHPHGWAI